MTAVAIGSALVVAWVYAGYPLTLWLLGVVRPSPRETGWLEPRVSVIVAAHDEVEVIADKVANVLASAYPAERLELIVASDGSLDGTVEAARDAGAALVLDLPRMGKLAALNRAVAAARGEVLVFTDADSLFEPGTLRRIASNFADERVGGVAANIVRVVKSDGRPVARGEGLYWRYERLLKRLEDRVGSVVSASGHLYAIRRSCFRESAQTAGTDDFLISSTVVLQGSRLAFDEQARVLVATSEEGGTELRRKVRVMNRGLRSALALGDGLLPTCTGLYALEVVFHKLLRRLVAFFLLALLGATAALGWWLALAPQLAFYALAAAGALLAHTRWSRVKPLWIPYFFCLANIAAALAVLSLLAGVRFERWEPVAVRGVARG
ncbi:MAG TPA: glycosyltransferase [Thermoleophilaceae bacterium]|nr:glycosyltransferase [Thermoleophilaceae bacterium]